MFVGTRKGCCSGSINSFLGGKPNDIQYKMLTGIQVSS